MYARERDEIPRQFREIIVKALPAGAVTNHDFVQRDDRIML